MTESVEIAAEQVAQAYLLQALYGDVMKRATHVSIPAIINYADAHRALVAMYRNEVQSRLDRNES